MQPKSSLGILFIVVLSFFGLSEQAKADFYQNTGFFPNPPDSGSAFGTAHAPNAVATSISSSISYTVADNGEVFLHTSFSVSGKWGDPLSGDPWHDVLENYGLHSSNSIHLTEVTIDGDTYEFESVVSLNLIGLANLVFSEDQTEMTGFFFAGSSGQGTVPIQSWSWVQIFEPGLPSGTEWQVNFNSKWVAAVDYHYQQVLPSPGVMTLLGIAGLVGHRRRR